jgi:serine/threonine-protein kinase
MAVTDDLARYRDIERLGVGGMATVTLAEDTLLGRRVALKRVHAGGDRRAIMRLRREALVGASLSHPNLVAIYDVDVDPDDELVIVMEYVSGGTLRDAIVRSGGLPGAFVLEVLAGVASALDAIHARGIVHRDVKPANILLGPEGAVKLADLGIAVAADRTQITSAGVILGTFSYMAPEQLEGESATSAVDVYALAVVAYEMLSGEKARPQTNPVALAHAMSTQPPPDLRAICPDAPPAAAAVLELGMAADPRRRPRSAGELVDRLRAALAPDAPTSPLAPPPPPAPPAPALAPPPAPRPAPAPHRPPPRADPTAGRRPGRRRPLPAARSRSGLTAAVVTAVALTLVALALLDSGATPPPATASTAARATGKPGAATAPATGDLSASTPAGAVQSFYARAAAHDYAGAWALADPAFRAQLEGFASFAAGQSRVRSITFQEARPTSQSAQAATVAVRTTAVLTSLTQHCQGTVDLVRTSAGAWLLHQISINCA